MPGTASPATVGLIVRQARELGYKGRFIKTGGPGWQEILDGAGSKESVEGMIGMGYGFISGAVAAGIAAYWPRPDFGRIASRLYIAWGIAAISLPVLAGHLFDLPGGYRTAVIVAGVGNLLAVGVALSLPRRMSA